MSSGTYKIIMSIVPLGVPGALLIVWLVNVCVWIRMAVVYRQRILALRLGKYVTLSLLCAGLLAWPCPGQCSRVSLVCVNPQGPRRT